MSCTCCAPADEEVTSGKISILITSGMLPFQQDFDLCETMEDYNLNCPVESGAFSFGLTMNIPGYLPAVSHIYHVMPGTCSL